MKKIFSLFLILLFSCKTALSLDPTTAVMQDVRKYTVQDSIDLSMNVSYLFIPQIAELEEQGVGWFGKCKVFTEPLTPEKVGLGYEKYGVIDPIKAQYLQNLHGTYGDIAYVADEKQVVDYANCLLRYGAVLAQAQINLYNSLKRAGSIIKNREGRVKGRMKLEEFKQIIRRALLDAMDASKHSPQVKQWASKSISGLCRFAGSPGVIMCEAYLVKLQPPQELSLHGFQLFGAVPFGLGGHIKIAKGAGAETTTFEYIPVKNL
jgi:uncharacterized protein YjhX (UPF0386 family)